ncbi:MAG: hypothetical protein COT16_01700, partial [Elusimicrobia bacterium CG08_land_8_20_14_0_20_44_26]
MSIKKILFVSAFVFTANAYAFNTDIINMVGIPAGSTSTVILPSVIKAGSDWIPLYKITISTDYAAAGHYDIIQITFTLGNQNAFDPTVDLSAIGIFNDDQSGTLNDQIWALAGDTASGRTIYSGMPTPLFSGTSYYYRLNINAETGSDHNRIASNNRDNTLYFCIKTSNNIED